MAERSNAIAQDMLAARGFTSATPESIERSVRAVLEMMPTALYGRADDELTEAELEVLREGGLDLLRTPENDPFAEPVACFAALVASSLSVADVAKRLAVQPGQIRQMIARHTLYSVKLDDRRHVPLFQFRRSGPLVPNITHVNAALPLDLHPVAVYNWYTRPDVDLVINEDGGECSGMTPIEWLDSGGDPAPLVSIVERL